MTMVFNREVETWVFLNFVFKEYYNAPFYLSHVLDTFAHLYDMPFI